MPFPVLGTTVNADRIVGADDEFGALGDPLTYELSCSAVNVQQVELSHYLHAEVGMTVKQIGDQTFLSVIISMSSQRAGCTDACDLI